MVERFMKNYKKKKYDFVYLTNTPSFYKVNLCNEIAKKNSLLLVLYGYGSEAVNEILTDNKSYAFDYIFLYNGKSEQRNKIVTLYRLVQLFLKIKYKKILYSGWFVPEYNIISFFTPRSKNCVICESSIRESILSGYKGLAKKLIINRMSASLPSGHLHKEIFKEIDFKGKISITGGVGIFNKGYRSEKKERSNQELKYLYVGRLIEVKNLIFLINEFNKNGKPLAIVGKGILEKQLHQIAKSNISFLGFVDNNKLSSVYQEHDVFILPSYSEPWGLVVDEALYYGLPVIVSNQVGCSIDLVELPQTGCVFDINKPAAFQDSLDLMKKNYNYFKTNVNKIDFNKRDISQVNAYIQLLND